MPPAVDRSPSIVSSQLSGRRLFAKITSPFASKSRTIADFSIEVDHPHKQYSPGDLVTGSVRLRVVKPVRVTHIVVSLHGYVQVFKNPGSPNDSSRATQNYIGTGRGKQSGEYFGNGFASLFEDELVLCGDGRLAEGSYQFNFELEFPDQDLPSSIDFERGTITYMITATMTRPTAIAPTLTCDRKVYFVERIDISPLQPPRPRTITLEAVSRRSRAKSQARKLAEAEKRSRRTDSSEHNSNPSQSSNAASAHSTSAPSEPPGSPSPSQVSFDSMVSGSNGRASRADTSRHSQQTSTDDQTSTSKASSENGRTINATVESLHGGCLRGDNISIKATINHTKPVKSVYGVIVTLYRQARVDMHPAIPLGPAEKGVKEKYEDYYPKSMTGLGGLSLSGAGSSHVFRKDLVQTLAPLYVDPHTFTAEVNAKVRIPDDAFPTISTVPGSMISFKYYVEVVLDIQGKLGAGDRGMGTLGLTTSNSHMGMGGIGGLDTERTATTPFGSTIIDTTQIRRDKGVVACTFELVIGTRDSERRKGKKKIEVIVDEEPQTEQGASHPTDGTHSGVHWYDEQYDYSNSYDGYNNWEYPPEGEPPAHQNGVMDYVTSMHEHDHYNMPPPVPIPSIPDESQMSEKERLRQAETRLLPSQPPGMENGDANGDMAGPSAPYLPDLEGDAAHVPMAGPSAPAYTPSSAVDPASDQGPSAPYMPEENMGAHVPSAEDIDNTPAAETSNQSAPPVDVVPINNEPIDEEEAIPQYEPPQTAESSRVAGSATDNKRELEQQGAQTETQEGTQADFNEHAEAGPSTSISAFATATSAPPPTDEPSSATEEQPNSPSTPITVRGATPNQTNGESTETTASPIAGADEEAEDLPRYER